MIIFEFYDILGLLCNTGFTFDLAANLRAFAHWQGVKVRKMRKFTDLSIHSPTFTPTPQFPFLTDFSSTQPPPPLSPPAPTLAQEQNNNKNKNIHTLWTFVVVVVGMIKNNYFLPKGTSLGPWLVEKVLQLWNCSGTGRINLCFLSSANKFYADVICKTKSNSSRQ